MRPRGYAHSLALLLPMGLIAGLASVVLLATKWPYLAVAPPLAVFLITMLARFPEWGYYIIVFMVPLNAWRGLLEDYPFLTISKIAGFLTLIILFVRHACTHEPLGRLRTSLWIPLSAFGIISIISTLFSVSVLHSLDTMRQLVTGLLVLLLTLYFTNRRRLCTVVPLLLIASTTFSAFLAIVGFWFDISSLSMDVNLKNISMRAVGASVDPNFFASMILVGLPCIAHYLFEAKTWKVRGLWLGLFAHNSYALLLTYSRSVTLIFAIIMALLVIEHIRKIRIRYIGFMILALAVIVPVAAYKLPETKIYERMASLGKPAQDTSLVRRGSYLIVAADAIMDNPVLGSGPGTFAQLYSKTSYAYALSSNKTDLARKAHNTYIEVAVGMGLSGLLVFLATLVLAFRYLYKAQRIPETVHGIPPGLIRALGYGLFSFALTFFFLSALEHKYLWLLLGFSAAAYNLSRVREIEA